MIIKVMKSKPDSGPWCWCLCHRQWHSREY